MNVLRSGHILVIDDDDDALANLRDILELNDYRVEVAATASEALNRTDWSTLSAIVLDRCLPDASADELLPKLRQLAPEVPVIVVTGYADIEGALAALRQGAADYILKPLNPNALLASLERVAERRRLALAKERSEAAFRQLVEAAECMIVILRPDQSILYFSPFAELLTGYPAMQVRGQAYGPLFSPETDRGVMADEINRILGGQIKRGFESSVVCRDSSRRWIVWNARLLDDYEGAPAILAVGQDITKLKQSQERELQTERLAAIGEVVAGLAHESRNALQRSQACLEMLALHVRDRPHALDLIARLQKAQDYLHHIYEDVRSYAAPIKLERQSCDLGDVWRDAWANLEAARNHKTAALVESVGSIDLHCSVDELRLGQVFRNIFENALAAGEQSVKIELRCAEYQSNGRSAVRIAVRDSGPGLNREQRLKIFEPFYTTKTKGTGLGMAICKRIIEAHGGQIEVGDCHTHGTEIVLTLPRNSP
jgi:PAS domain S-box-containing protein